MAEYDFSLEVSKRQISKDILKDLGIERALTTKYSNIPAQAEQLIDEYGKYYKKLYKYINSPID